MCVGGALEFWTPIPEVDGGEYSGLGARVSNRCAG